MKPAACAIVTGSSRGIGAAIARRLAAEGYAVCVNYKQDKKSADAVVKSIVSAGGKAMAVQADMASEADIVRLFDVAQKELGALSVLVNNAGITSPRQPLAELTAAHIDDIFATNTKAVFLCCREAAKRMKAGSIINITSEAAKFGGNRIAAYAASKAAVNTLTLALSRELAPIRVNAISPGIIDTEMHGDMDEAKRAALIASIPAGRMGTPEDVANVAAWLASDEAAYVSGAIIPVAGAR